jgi:hypothetical protein
MSQYVAYGPVQGVTDVITPGRLLVYGALAYFGWFHVLKPAREDRRRQAEAAARVQIIPKGQALPGKGWFVRCYNYRKGNRDRRVKEIWGPYATKAEAQAKLADARGQGYYPTVSRSSR